MAAMAAVAAVACARRSPTTRGSIAPATIRCSAWSTLGSDELQKQGYTRVKHEMVVGPMPPFGGIIKTSDQLWKVIAFIRSVNPSSEKHEGDAYAPNPY